MAAALPQFFGAASHPCIEVSERYLQFDLRRPRMVPRVYYNASAFVISFNELDYCDNKSHHVHGNCSCPTQRYFYILVSVRWTNLEYVIMKYIQLILCCFSFRFIEGKLHKINIILLVHYCLL